MTLNTDLISRSVLKEELAPQDDWSWKNGAYVRETIDAMPTVGGWVSVKDRLPDKSGQYLVAMKGTVPYIDIARFLENLCDNPQFEYEDVPDVPGFYKGDGEGDWIVSGVTHWMPLPEPPKEDDNAER